MIAMLYKDKDTEHKKSQNDFERRFVVRVSSPDFFTFHDRRIFAQCVVFGNYIYLDKGST